MASNNRRLKMKQMSISQSYTTLMGKECREIRARFHQEYTLLMERKPSWDSTEYIDIMMYKRLLMERKPSWDSTCRMFFAVTRLWLRKGKRWIMACVAAVPGSQPGLYAKQKLPWKKENCNKKGCASGLKHPNSRNLSMCILLVRGQKEVSRPCNHRAMSPCFYFILV